MSSILGLIAGGLAFSLSPSYIVTGGMNFGVQPIILQALAPSRAFGDPTLVTLTPAGPSGATVLPAYRTFIAGVDRTAYVQPGISIQSQSNSRATCSFTLLGWRPAFDSETGAQYIPSQSPPDAVQIRRASDGLLMFNGFVDTLSTARLWGPASAVSTQVSCVDLGVICDRRIVGWSGGIFYINAPADSVITTIVNKFLAGTGISFVYSSNVNVPLGAQLYPYQTVTEVFNSIAQQTNTNWSIDINGNLRFYDATSGYLATAPANVDDTTQLVDLTLNPTAVRFANRWFAKSNQNLGNAVYVDTYTQTQAGWTGFLLTQAGPSGSQVPGVTINGVVKKVISLFPPAIQPNDTSWDFAYIGLSVVYNWRLPAIQIGDVIKISYPSPLPYVAIAEDTGSIAAVGLVEATVEAGAITDKTTLQNIANTALALGKVIPKILTYTTRTDGYQVGQKVHVTRTELGVNDDFVATAVSSREIDQLFFLHQVTLSNATAQLASNPNKFFGDLIKNTRMTNYNIIERITFNLAVTVEGLTNPGLTTGIKPAIKTAQKNGTAAWVTLIFNSLSQLGGVTATDIVIDMLKNGASVYGSTVLTLPAGYSGEVKFSIFATDPLLVKVGDVFTMNVTSADSAAMDGVMELVTLG